MQVLAIGVMPHAHWLAKCSDVLTIYLIGFLTFAAFFHLPLWQWERYHWMVSLTSLAAIVIFSLHGVYQSWRGAIRVRLVVRLFHGFIGLGALIATYLYLTKAGHHFSRLWFTCWLGLSFFAAVLTRIAAYRVLNWLRQHGHNIKEVALFGTTTACLEVFKDIQNERLSGFQVHQIRLIEAQQAEFALFPSTVDVSLIDFSGERSHSPEIWICLPLSAGERVMQILQALRYSTANIRYLPDLRDVRLINHQVSYVVGHYALDLSISPMHGGQRALKWLFDKCFAIIALLLLSPIFLLVGMWIFLVGRGEVFYRQTRVGWNGKTFEMIKFRTMPKDNEINGTVWGKAGEKKTIPLGRLLRRLSIDELPQFWNVLKGDMSIVGPRPERPQFVEQFKDEITGYMQKHMVKAGMTGWAQVHGWRGDTDLQQRINHDLWYIENWSIWLDSKILLLTIAKIFKDPSAL